MKKIQTTRTISAGVKSQTEFEPYLSRFYKFFVERGQNRVITCNIVDYLVVASSVSGIMGD